MATHRSLSTDDAVDAATTPGRFRTLLQRGTNTGACICTLQHGLAHAHKQAHTHKHAAMTPGPFHTLLQTSTQRYLNMHMHTGAHTRTSTLTHILTYASYDATILGILR